MLPKTACPLHDRFCPMNRHSPARIERPFRAITGCEQSQQRGLSIPSPRRRAAEKLEGFSDRRPLGGLQLHIPSSSSRGGCGGTPADIVLANEAGIDFCTPLPCSCPA